MNELMDTVREIPASIVISARGGAKAFAAHRSTSCMDIIPSCLLHSLGPSGVDQFVHPVLLRTARMLDCDTREHI